jgi:uncharacterized protein YebE (UPF0316 family)
MIDANTLQLGLLIFFARLVDVSIGTIRTIFITVHGRSVVAFFLAIFERIIWISVIGTVVHNIENLNPF